MKFSVLFVGSALAFATLAAERTPSATERLRERLLEIGRSDKFVYAWSTSWWSWNDKWFDAFHRASGVWPSLCFHEFRDICGTWNTPGYYATNRTNFTAVVTRGYRERGTIPLVTWHLENPYIPPKWGANQDHQGFRYRYSEPGYPREHRDVMREIAEGTGSPCGSGRIDGGPGKTFPNPRAWYEWVVKDMTAFWRTVRDDAGRPIPIVFRLFHEMDGDWFWWGPGSATAQDYIAVYRLTVDLIRKELGAENVLFCYGPDRCWTEAGEEGKSGYLKWYPGDAYVDIMGFDDYSIGKGDTDEKADANFNETLRKLRLVCDYARPRGKVVGVTETGCKDARTDFWARLLRLAVSEGVDCAFVDTWGGPWSYPDSDAGIEDQRRFLADPAVLMVDGERLRAAADRWF